MPEKWTGEVVGKMHIYKVTQEDLAREMGVTKSYVSMVLNSSRKPPKAEERIKNAMRSILERRKKGERAEFSDNA